MTKIQLCMTLYEKKKKKYREIALFLKNLRK